MLAIVAGDETRANSIDKLPGILAIGTQRYRNDARIEVDQVGLFAAVRVVAGITRAKAMECVQIFPASSETCCRDRICPSGIRGELVTLEAQLALGVDGWTATRSAALVWVGLCDVLRKAI